MLLRFCNLAAEALVWWPDDAIPVGVVVDRKERGFDEPTCMLAGRLSFLALAGSVVGEICGEVKGEGTTGREALGGGCGGWEVCLLGKDRGAAREYSREEKRRGNWWADRVDDTSGGVRELLGVLVIVLVRL